MNVLELDRITLNGAAASRDEAIREVGEMLVGAGAVQPAYIDAMFDRENTVSTYMGNWLAIPHGTNEAKDTILRSAWRSSGTTPRSTGTATRCAS